MSDPFAHAESTAHEWLAVVRDHLGAKDDRDAHRMLRAWLHTVRDRLTVEGAARFAAQLPELLRGLFYEGWHPAFVPTRYAVPGFVARFAGSADSTRAEVPAAVGSLCRLDGVLELLPVSVVELLGGKSEARRPLSR